MKIKDFQGIRRVDANRPPAVQDGRKADVPPVPDRVSTEGTGRLAGAVASAQTAAAGSREVSIEAIKAAIRNGTFKPDPQRIADKVLGDAEISAALQAMLQR